MDSKGIVRRNLLKAVAGIPATSWRGLIPLWAGEAHGRVRDTKAQSTGGAHPPRFFNPHEYATLQALCEAIIPRDDKWGGALEAGAPEFIDLLMSENEDYQRRLGGGLTWLNATCLKRYDKAYLECSPSEREEILDLIAYRANAAKDPGLAPGIGFFAFLRELTVDGYFTSETGIKYLGYIGNTFLTEFAGCPPVRDA